MNCPYCSANKNELFYQLEEFNLLQCKKCSFRFIDLQSLNKNQPTQEINISNIWHVNTELPHIKRRVRNVMEFISYGKILDIGCGRGEFAVAMAEKGFFCTGIDTDDKAIKQLKSNYPEVIWITGLIENNLEDIGTFDVITLYHVLEHVTDPIKMMEVIKSILKPGGLIVVEVPNVFGLNARIKGSSWNYYHSDHLCYFGTKHLEGLADRFDMDIVKKKSYYHFSYPQGNIWKDLLKSMLASIGFKDVISIFLRNRC